MGSLILIPRPSDAATITPIRTVRRARRARPTRSLFASLQRQRVVKNIPHQLKIAGYGYPAYSSICVNPRLPACNAGRSTTGRSAVKMIRNDRCARRSLPLSSVTRTLQASQRSPRLCVAKFPICFNGSTSSPQMPENAGYVYPACNAGRSTTGRSAAKLKINSSAGFSGLRF